MMPCFCICSRDFSAGHNVFFTGVAGTGKSFLLLQIISQLRASYKSIASDSIAVVAPTGTMAVACGGQTIHSFSGVGVPRMHSDFRRAWRPTAWRRWRQLQVLVIEEVSMISGELLDCL